MSGKITNLGKLEKLTVVILYSRLEEIGDSESSSLSPFHMTLRISQLLVSFLLLGPFRLPPLDCFVPTVLSLGRLHSLM